MMDKTFFERRAYKGGLRKRGYKATGISLVLCQDGELPSELVKVWSMEEYSSGCSLHKNCPFGHMCVTPEGIVLPPHSMSFRSGDIRTQYYIAANKAFDGKGREYIESLKSTNYGKEGHLRSIMSTPVSGSARLVCASQTGSDPYVVYISKNLADKIVFCCTEESPLGVLSSRYSERSLQEGDYVMLERAPSLSKHNNQPFKVRFWDKECLGIHPKVFSYFHGDYDGDESHIYALDDPESIREAENWVPPLDRKLTLATKYMIEFLGDKYECDTEEGDLNFMSYNTLSFSEIKDGDLSLPLGDLTKNKAEHLQMFRDRMNTKGGTTTFLRDSMKGVKDIMRQQVSQGSIGDMARVAKIAASCFTRGKEGGTYVTLRRTRVLLRSDTSATKGIPSVRCVMSLCQASQQAALDAHRVGSSADTGLDMISDLLLGRSRTKGNNPCYTLYVLRGTATDAARGSLDPTFCCTVGSSFIIVAKDSACENVCETEILGAYSPVVLSAISPDRREEAALLAVRVACNYYDIKFEGDDIRDMAIALSYRAEKSLLPVTTRQGMLDRGLGWTDTLMATDYTKLPLLKGSASGVFTVTSAVMCSNFDEV